MFVIGEAVVEENVATERFSCDVSKCKGACCTLPGGRGAPLEDREVDEILAAFPSAAAYLPARNLDVIAREGMVEGTPGSYATTCIDDRDCVFVYYEGDVARCALERAYADGKTSWRKPVSCHLFPIRIRRDTMDRIRYERIPECAPGRQLGLSAGTPLYEYLRPALVRKYGEQWYEEFHRACEVRHSPGSHA